jgi:uncharacterized repeat protein (TIGR03943 family)
MVIYNFKVNAKAFSKILLTILGIIILVIFSIAIYKIYVGTIKVNDEIPVSDVQVINSENYTNTLKTVHDNLSEYTGRKICISGYIYKLPDFSQNQFVLARDMIISSDLRTLVVGFLCNCNEISNFKEKSWVTIIGTIERGNYHEEIPVIQVTNIKQIEKPSDEFVYPPDSSYVPTSALF